MTHPAIKFLNMLDRSPDATFNIECYTDLPKGAQKPQSGAIAKRFPDLTIADAEELLPRLHVLNARGAGIFVAVNQFNGQRGKINLSRVRGVHADLDGVDQHALDTIRAILQPTIEVQSSGPMNWHFYWLVADGQSLEAADAESINRSLVQFGADPAAIDTSRLLRLPGFLHMKNREVA
ncbi:DNA-primase RepB domain-containing protein [Yoonia vestfoldensis]|jgi:hypothetical protein|uniref:RepB DNA-primase from phage plasmid n=1 Tax=Yoonia vestfoldensis TaxID=245188 RepID=A0A1Y0EE38_9RHOB|nr:DNA-primase RepB domain-containing protein [Yoonia vestfoldensis]ARU01679.1 RepB DNA-primase from phage plasmid [Yoonia vestfoldensis]